MPWYSVKKANGLLNCSVRISLVISKVVPDLQIHFSKHHPTLWTKQIFQLISIPLNGYLVASEHLKKSSIVRIFASSSAVPYFIFDWHLKKPDHFLLRKVEWLRENIAKLEKKLSKMKWEKKCKQDRFATAIHVAS